MAHLVKCCCYIELRTGTIALAVLGLLVSIWNLVSSATGYVYYFNDAYFMDLVAGEEHVMAVLRVLRPYFICSMILSVFMIGSSALLLFGAVKVKRIN